MRKLLIFCFGVCVTACDGGFRVRGTIFAQNTPIPAICKVVLKGPPDALTCCNQPVSPPTIDIRFTVRPFKTQLQANPCM